MPVTLKSPSNKDGIEALFHQWLELLAEERYAEAFHITAHDPYFSWTPELIESMIKGYGLPYEEGETAYKVTDWKVAASDGSKHYRDIELFDAPRSGTDQNGKVIGAVYYDLPLNGKVSDLTAMFRVIQQEDNCYLELVEIHVL